MTFKDKAGRPLKAGDYVVYGHALGRCAALQYGKVLAVTKSKTKSWNWDEKTQTEKEFYPTVLRVQSVNLRDNWGGEDLDLNKPGTLLFESRVLKITEDQMPKAVKKLLDTVALP